MFDAAASPIVGMRAPFSEPPRRAHQRMAQRLWELRKSREHATDEDPILTTKTGKRHNYGNLYHRVLKPAMRAAGIEHRAFHRLRHSCVTQLRRREASLEEIQL